MSRIAVVTDSNSRITEEEAKEFGIYILPMPFSIDDEDYFEGVNLSVGEFYEKLTNKEAKIFTSQPSPESVMNIWDEALKENDYIIHIPMSSGLSSSCQTAIMLSGEDDYDGKVFVVNNQRISVTHKRSVFDAIELIKQGKSAEEVKNILEEEKLEASIYIMLDTLLYLKRGGRITPAAAALGNLLKLKPVLQIQGDKLDEFAKARTIKQAKSLMLEAMLKDIENRFGGKENVYLYVVHTENLEAAKEFKEEVAQAIPGIDIQLDELPLSIACHIGPGSLAIACAKKIS